MGAKNFLWMGKCPPFVPFPRLETGTLMYDENLHIMRSTPSSIVRFLSVKKSISNASFSRTNAKTLFILLRFWAREG